MVTPSHPRGTHRGLRPGGLSTSGLGGNPISSSGHPQGARAWRPLRIRLSGHPGCSSGHPQWGSGHAASLHQAGRSPRPILGAPTGGSGPVASPRRAERSSWLFLRAPTVGLRPCGPSASGWAVTPSYPRGNQWGSGLAASAHQSRMVTLSPPQGSHRGLRPSSLSAQAGRSPCPLLGAPTGGSGPAASPHQAGRSPRPLLGAPTGGSGLQRSHCLPSSPPGSGACGLSPFNLSALVSSWVKWAW